MVSSPAPSIETETNKSPDRRPAHTSAEKLAFLARVRRARASQDRETAQLDEGFAAGHRETATAYARQALDGSPGERSLSRKLAEFWDEQRLNALFAAEMHELFAETEELAAQTAAAQANMHHRPTISDEKLGPEFYEEKVRWTFRKWQQLRSALGPETYPEIHRVSPKQRRDLQWRLDSKDGLELLIDRKTAEHLGATPEEIEQATVKRLKEGEVRNELGDLVGSPEKNNPWMSPDPWPEAAVEFVEVNGADVAYRHIQRAGPDAPTAILLHGSGSRKDIWPRFAKPLVDKGINVVMVDVPGFGESDFVDDYSLAAFGRWLPTFMDAVEIEQAHLVGNSHGGLVALWGASEAPERVRSLHLSAPAAPPRLRDSLKSPTNLQYLTSALPGGGVKALFELPGSKTDTATKVVNTTHSAKGPLTASRLPQEITENEQLAHSKRRRLALVAVMRAMVADSWRARFPMLGESTWDRLRRIPPRLAKNTVVYTGALDEVVSPTMQKAVHQKLPGSTYVEKSVDGHVGVSQQFPNEYGQMVAAAIWQAERPPSHEDSQVTEPPKQTVGSTARDSRGGKHRREKLRSARNRP